MDRVVVAAMYHFVRQPLDNLLDLRRSLLSAMQDNGLRGTLLIATEGINGTIAGSKQGIDAIVAQLRAHAQFTDLQVKYSYNLSNPFQRAKVKLKKEIVTMGVGEVAVAEHTAEHVSPSDWDALVADPECVVIDTRNDYEVEIGTFKGAINPRTETFREFPEYIQERFGDNKDQKIAMFCTGGIRCEKASAYMKEQGYNNVYQLGGGVLQYLEDRQGESSAWEGDLFVFDDRVAVDKDLNKSKYHQCYACRRPLISEDMQHPHYQEGVSCHRCFNESSDAAKLRFAQRQKQMLLAKARGVSHLGVNQRLSEVEKG